jgi:hypothetical protein
LGFLGVDGLGSLWLSAAVIAAAAIVMVLLFLGRPWFHGLFASGAMISPSVMIGVERGNSFRNRASFAQLVYLPPGLRSCSEQGFIVLLGTNFIYRLMFLLHCIPQLLDWQIQRNASEKSAMIAELGLLGTVSGCSG